MSFQKIVGHSSQRNSLTRSVLKKHIGHAYLFSGPNGIGKKLIALEFAKQINCRIGKQIDGNKQCPCTSCSKIDKGIHPDVHLFDYEDIKTIKVDNIRDDVEKNVYLSPFESEFKVFIIDDAERMNFNAQNAFLKTLEEPPKNSVIILISSLSDQIIPTVKSRCQIINFNKLANKEVEHFLESTMELDSEQIKLIVRISDGSIGKALEIDNDFLELRSEYINEILKINANRPSTIFDLAEKILKLSKSSNSDDLKRFFDILSIWLSDSIATCLGLNENHIVNFDKSEEIKNYIENKKVKDLINKFDVLEESWANIVIYNANKVLAIENLLFTLTK